MSETTSEPHKTRPWYEVAPDLDDRRADPDAVAAYWLAYAQAHFSAYSDVLESGDSLEIAKASHVHLIPYMAGFTVAAQIKGWAITRITNAFEDGALAAELTWQWLTEAGIEPERIGSAVELIPLVEQRYRERQVARQPVGDGGE